MFRKLFLFPNIFLLSWGRRRVVFCFLAGAASALALPPYGMLPVLLVSVPAFVWILDGAIEPENRSILSRLKTGFFLGWLFGFGYFLAGLWWIGSAFLVEADRFAWLMPLAVLAMPSGLALFTGVGVSLAAFLWSDHRSRMLLLGACLTLAEWLRGHVLTGFPWNSFGYTVSESLVLSQFASVVGIYGMGFLVLCIAAAPAALADARPLSQRLMPAAVAVVALVLIAAFGAGRLWSTETEYTDLDIRIIQPSISQSDKWRPELREEIFQTYLDMSEAPLTGTARVGAPRLVVWPESSVPFLLTQEPGALSRIAGALGERSELAVGAVRVEPGRDGPDYFNSVYLIDTRGDVAGLYDKVRLVPFGEYIPFQELLKDYGLSSLAGPLNGFTAGLVREKVATSSGFSFLPLICYEVIFPDIADDFENRPEFFLNLTNDAWFGRTSGPYQHFAQARMRAIESGVPMIRAANTGISAIVDGQGKISASLPPFVPGVLDGNLPQRSGKTIYGKYGDIFALFSAMIIVVFGVILKYNRHSRLN